MKQPNWNRITKRDKERLGDLMDDYNKLAERKKGWEGIKTSEDLEMDKIIGESLSIFNKVYGEMSFFEFCDYIQK